MSEGPRTLGRLEGRLGGYAAPLLPKASGILRRAGHALGLSRRHEISLVLCDGPTIHRLNREWRSKDRPTDVLSFPLYSLKAGELPPEGPIGDIMVCLSVARRRARELGVPWERHFALLLIHSLLHLLGHDHEKAADARRMEKEEARLMHFVIRP